MTKEERYQASAECLCLRYCRNRRDNPGMEHFGAYD